MQTHDYTLAKMLSPVAVEQEYGIGRSLQARLRASRQLPYHKIGHRSVLMARADIEKFLAKRRINAIGERL